MKTIKKLLTAAFTLGFFIFSSGQEISLTTTYLSSPIEGFNRLAIDGDLASGKGRLTADPNQCSLNGYGDTTGCTKMATQIADITLNELEIHDSLFNRRMFLVADHPLPGKLVLIVPTSGNSSFRFVYTPAKGNPSVVTLESVTNCHLLARTVHQKKAQAKVVGGFLTDTYILIVEGETPNQNTPVKLHPLEYVAQPDYWEIQVIACPEGGITLPSIGTYRELLPLDNYRGKKGIKVVWANGEGEQIDVP